MVQDAAVAGKVFKVPNDALAVTGTAEGGGKSRAGGVEPPY